MTEIQVLTALWTGAFLLVHLGVIARVILRPHREPASRVAWIRKSFHGIGASRK